MKELPNAEIPTKTNQVLIKDGIGLTTETAAASDSAASGLNGLFKRLLARITAIIALLPTSLDSGRLRVALPAAATVSDETAQGHLAAIDTKLGGPLTVDASLPSTYPLSAEQEAMLTAIQAALEGTLAVDVSLPSTYPLPTSQANSLSNIDTKTPSLEGGRVPVVLSGPIEVSYANPSTVMANGTVTVTDEATAILASNSSRKTCQIRNHSAKILYIGSSDTVSVETGYPVFPNETWAERFTGAIYGIMATGESGDVRWYHTL